MRSLLRVRCSAFTGRAGGGGGGGGRFGCLTDPILLRRAFVVVVVFISLDHAIFGRGISSACEGTRLCVGTSTGSIIVYSVSEGGDSFVVDKVLENNHDQAICCITSRGKTMVR